MHASAHSLYIVVLEARILDGFSPGGFAIWSGFAMFHTNLCDKIIVNKNYVCSSSSYKVLNLGLIV